MGTGLLLYAFGLHRNMSFFVVGHAVLDKAQRCHSVSLRMEVQGFPGGAVVERPPAAAGDTGSCPGLGRSHMPRSGWAREPWPLSLRVQSLCSATGEATTVRGHNSERPAYRKKQTNKQKKIYNVMI